jgi:hypothetical protein
VWAGNGDAICIRYGNDQTGHFVHVVDGGRRRNMHTLSGG